MPPSYIVRDLRADDLDSVAWAGSPTDLRYVAEAVKRASRDEVDYLCLAVGDAVLAIGAVDYMQKDGIGVLWKLQVHPEYRSQGLGTGLVRALEQRAMERGCSGVELTVRIENERAQALYRGLGYEVAGTTHGSWQYEASDGTIQTRHAIGIVMEKSFASVERPTGPHNRNDFDASFGR